MTSFTNRHGLAAALVAAFVTTLAACSGAGSDPKPAPECALAADCAAPGVCEHVACVSGACVLSSADVGATCGMGLRCDAAGGCVECLSASDCPGTDTACRTRACDAGTCRLEIAIAGTPLATQIAGDCREDRCDAAGNVTSAVDDADLPDDGNDCTSDACGAGSPSSTPVGQGTPCSAGLCNASGQCVGCLAPSDCPGTDTACRSRTCDAGVCGASYATAGTLAPGGVPGDCHKNVCNGSGSVVPAVDDTDVPVDGNACTSDVCTSGVPTNPAASAGTACATGGGTVCNGSGVCVECLTGPDCTSGVCSANVCQAPACDDRVRNGNETDVDCGGTCSPCATGKTCMVNGDCATASCVSHTCAP